MSSYRTSKEIIVPEDPLERIIGQDITIEKVKTAIRQRRHLLLVGPPGTGKSMIAQAISYHLPKPQQQISIIENLENPQHPLVVIKERGEVEKENKTRFKGKIINPEEAPTLIAERLGYRCHSCGRISKPDETCGSCGTEKKTTKGKNPFKDVMTEVLDIGCEGVEEQVKARVRIKNKEEIIIYRRRGEKIQMISEKEIEREAAKNRENVIISLNRKTFVHATGASETELLGDVRHDPYGSHPEIGTPPYRRVIPGVIHEAHEGVLFIDELPHLGNLQNFILTAMQERKFPVVGRNPQSAGAAIKVDEVPCDFLFVGACNIKDVHDILSPLRSRILGNGYELLLDTTMPDTKRNRLKLMQFIAQEIRLDGRIPHADNGAIDEVIEVAKTRAREIDDARDSLTLRLRGLSGLIKMGGDFAVLENSNMIRKKHIEKSASEAMPIEDKLKNKYGSMWKAERKESVASDGSGSINGYV